MAKIQNYTSRQNLEDYSVYIEDTEPLSDYFRLSELSEVLTSGKNAFLINGSPYLRQTTEVLVEIIDAAGNAVYLHPIRNYAEGLSRIVSVEVYKTTPRGKAKLIILGEAETDKNGIPVPPQWRGKYNLRYTKELIIDPTILNTTRIRLYDRPAMDIEEVQVPYVEVRTLGSASLESASLMSSPGINPRVASFSGFLIVKDEKYLVKLSDPLLVAEMADGKLSASIASASTVEVSQTQSAYDSFTGADGTSVSSSHTPDTGWAYILLQRFHTNSVIIDHNTAMSVESMFGGREGIQFYPAITNDNFEYYADIKLPPPTPAASGVTSPQGIICRVSGTIFDSTAFTKGIILNLDASGYGYTASTIVLRQVNQGSTVETTTLAQNIIFPNGLANSESQEGLRLGMTVAGKTFTCWYEPYGGGARTNWADPYTFSSTAYVGEAGHDTFGLDRVNSIGNISGSWDNVTLLTQTVNVTPNIKVYSSIIESVETDTTLRLKAPYLIDSASNLQTSPWATYEWSIEWSSGSTIFRTEESRSFADITLNNLKTFSGDVARAKFYVKTVDGLGAYEQVAELDIEEHELTLTQSYGTGEVNIQMGEFKNQTFTDQYWIADSISSSSYSA